MLDFSEMRHPLLRQSVGRLFDAIDGLRAGRISAAGAEAEIKIAKAVLRKARSQIRRGQFRRQGVEQ